MGEYTAAIKKMIFSFSRIHSFEGCKYEWYLNYLLRDDNGEKIYDSEQNFYAAFGAFCHDILEKILKGTLKVTQATAYYMENFEEKVFCEAPPSTKEKYYLLGLDYFKNLNFEWLSEYEVLGIEKKCSFKIKEVKFTGYIDLLIRNKATQEIILVDHKSSEYPIGKRGKVLKNKEADYENYKKQLYLYATQVFLEYGVYPKKIVWNYFKSQQWLELPFIFEEYDAAQQWALDTVEKICEEQDFIPHKDYFYCHNLCGFRNSCDYRLLEEGS